MGHRVAKRSSVQSSPSDVAGAPHITPAMMAAGVDALLALDREFDPPEQVVREVYEAMREASLIPPREPRRSSR